MLSKDENQCRHSVFSQSAFTCSKLTIETLEQDVNYVEC